MCPLSFSKTFSHTDNTAAERADTALLCGAAARLALSGVTPKRVVHVSTK